MKCVGNVCEAKEATDTRLFRRSSPQLTSHLHKSFFPGRSACVGVVQGRENLKYFFSFRPQQSVGFQRWRDRQLAPFASDRKQVPRWGSACTRPAHCGGPRVLDPAAHLAPYIGLSRVERSGSRDCLHGLSRNFHFQSFRFARAHVPRPLFPRHRAVQELSFAPIFEPRKSELPSPRSKLTQIAQTAARQHAVFCRLWDVFSYSSLFFSKN